MMSLLSVSKQERCEFGTSINWCEFVFQTWGLNKPTPRICEQLESSNYQNKIVIDKDAAETEFTGGIIELVVLTPKTKIACIRLCRLPSSGYENQLLRFRSSWKAT